MSPLSPKMRRQSIDSWLNEQSMLTDESYRDAVDFDITDEKYLHKVIAESTQIKKRSKAQFLGSAMTPKANPLAKPGTAGPMARNKSAAAYKNIDFTLAQ